MTCNKINNNTTKKSTKRKDKNNAMGARALVTGTACIMATNIGKVSKNPDDQKGEYKNLYFAKKFKIISVLKVFLLWFLYTLP